MKNRKKIIVITIIFIIMCWGCISYFDMTNLPKGEYLSSLNSPNEKYTLNAYLFDGCGATCAFTLRVELVNNETKKVKNIYWQYRDSEANMKWINDDNVEINGKKLNIKKNKFVDLAIDIKIKLNFEKMKLFFSYLSIW